MASWGLPSVGICLLIASSLLLHSAVLPIDASSEYLVETGFEDFRSRRLGQEQVTVQNLRDSPIAVCSNVASGPIILHPNEAKPLPVAQGSSLFLWACELDDIECINTQNPTATMAGFNMGNDSNSYLLSAENGYNLPIKITCLSGTSPAITCAGNLNDCPNELQIRNSSGAVAKCKPPVSESSQLYPLYSSMVANSDCQMPGSSYDPSSISSTCPSATYLVVSFISKW